MKKLRLLLPILMICTMLSGCQLLLPFFFLNLTGSDTTPTATELPVVGEADTTLSAEDIYWRAKLAFNRRPTQYSEITTVGLKFEDQEISFPMDMHYDTHVTLNEDACAVNVQTFLAYDNETPEEFWDYYRDEGGALVYYYQEVQTGYCSREVIDLEDATPYVIILDFTVSSLPYDPQALSVEPRTRMLNGREVYVLTFQQSALYTFGYTGNSLRDTQLSQRMIPMTWYVDAQSYMPVQLDYTIYQMDDLIGDMVNGIYDVVGDGLSITGYSYSLQNIGFDPVDTGPVPEDVLKNAWNNGGYSPI